MGVNIPCVEKFGPRSKLRWWMQNGTDRKRVLKYISDCLGKRASGMQKGSVASLWRSGTARTDFPVSFDEQFVAVQTTFGPWSVADCIVF